MKWKTAWWGITLVAENEADNQLIGKLADSLPKEASDAYDDGVLSIKTEDGLKRLVFDR